MNSCYSHKLMDHYRYPRNRGTIENAHFSSAQYNPSCGDSIIFQGCLDETGIITTLGFEGQGCVISQATASLLSEATFGKDITQILSLDTSFITALIGIELGPTRLKCALLPLYALQEGIRLQKKEE